MSKELAKLKKSWNGTDYFFSFRHGRCRNWNDAKNYGFVSAGQGKWYTKTLDQLSLGNRIFVHIPNEGYVGVGVVNQEKTPITEFKIQNQKGRDLLDVELKAKDMKEISDDPEKREYIIGIDWLDTRPLNEAVWEKGLYANQNTVTKLEYEYTRDRLYDVFDLNQCE
jgi:hypothetical protein